MSEESWEIIMILPSEYCRHRFQAYGEAGCLHFEKRSAAKCDKEECPIRFKEDSVAGVLV